MLLSTQQSYSLTATMQVWPHVKPGRGVDSSPSTPHWAYQHAVQWWVTQVGQVVASAPGHAFVVYLTRTKRPNQGQNALAVLHGV